MPAGNVSVEAVFELIGADITISNGENGTLNVKNGSETVSSGDRVAKDTVLTVSAVPAPGYEVATLTYTVGSGSPVDIKDAADKTITVGTEDITITATYSERVYADGELKGATYISRNDDAANGAEADAKSNYSTTGELKVGNPDRWAGVGLILFNASVDDESDKPVYRANLKLTQKAIDSRLDNGFGVYSVTGDYDPTTITFVDVYGEECIADATKAAIQETSPIKEFTFIRQIGKNSAGTSGDNLTTADDGYVHNVDVTDYVKSVKAAKGTTYSLALNNARRGFSFYGYSSEHEPVLEIIRGVPATVTVQSAADADTKVEGAVVVIKDGEGTVVATETTDSNGVIDTVLEANKTYTYTVTSADYAIKKDGSITTTAESGSSTASLAANTPTSVVITAPETGTTIAAGETITYSAKVYDQDEREMSATVDWDVTLDSTSAADAAVTVANGVVTTTADSTGGAYTVTATVHDTSISDTEVLTISKIAKVAVSITANDSNGTVSYTVDGVASTDNEVLPGKTIVATATPNALYGFAGWATSADNATAGTYVSTDASYTVTTVENTPVTLIAVFEYNGIFYQEDFEGFVVGDSKAGGNEGLSSWTHTNGNVRIINGSAGTDTSNSTKILNWYLNQQNAARSNTHTINNSGYIGENGKVTFSAKVRAGGDPVANSGKTGRSYMGIQDNAGNVVFGFSWGTKNANDDSKLRMNVTSNSAETTDMIVVPSITEGNGGEITGLGSGYPTWTSKWFTLEVTLDTKATENNVTVKLTPLTATDSIGGAEAGATYTATYTNTTAKNIAKFATTLGNMNAGIALDDIVISAPAN